ncbi:MAG: hypothetical protein JO290_10035 [Sphingomonadaceae bacterium]|nr:hypothetical protein [Sphingomonadaceae bacterium]
MDPTDVRADLAARAAGGPDAMAISPAATPPGTAAILAGISASYFRLRRGLAIVAFAFPIVLAIGAGGVLQGSISAYYHYSRFACSPGGACPAGGGTMRDVFVGALWMIGSFLLFYRGYSRAEDRVLNVAGLTAVAISLSPMDWPAAAAATLRGRIHGTSAVVFFLCIAYVAIFRARDTTVLLDDARRSTFTAIYRTLGALMVVLPLGAVALHLLLPNPQSRVILGIEVSGIYVFAAFWLVKSREIALIEGR